MLFLGQNWFWELWTLRGDSYILYIICPPPLQTHHHQLSTFAQPPSCPSPAVDIICEQPPNSNFKPQTPCESQTVFLYHICQVNVMKRLYLWCNILQLNVTVDCLWLWKLWLHTCTGGREACGNQIGLSLKIGINSDTTVPVCLWGMGLKKIVKHWKF